MNDSSQNCSQNTLKSHSSTRCKQIICSGTSAEKGFTLIELMVVLIVAAIILAFAVPSFQGVINSNRVTTAVNELSTSFSIARTEAIKSNTIARVKPCTVGPGCDGEKWEKGYDIRVDINGDGTYADSATELVRIVDALDNQIGVFPGTTTEVYFNSLGGLGQTFYSSSGTTSFSIRADKAFTRVLLLKPSGAATVCVGSTVGTDPTCP